MALVGSSFAEVPEVPSELQRTNVYACVCVHVHVCVCVCVHVCTHAIYFILKRTYHAHIHTHMHARIFKLMNNSQN